TAVERAAAVRDAREPDADRLVEALKDEDADVRLVVVAKIRRERREGDEIARALVESLKYPHVGVRREVAAALCGMGPSVAPVLYEALKHADPFVRAGAAMAFGDEGMFMGGARKRAPDEELIITPILKSLLNDPDPNVRRNAAHTLKVLGWEGGAR